MRKQYVLSQQDYDDIILLLNRVINDLIPGYSMPTYQVLDCRNRVEEALGILESEE